MTVSDKRRSLRGYVCAVQCQLAADGDKVRIVAFGNRGFGVRFPERVPARSRDLSVMSWTGAAANGRPWRPLSERSYRATVDYRIIVCAKRWWGCGIDHPSDTYSYPTVISVRLSLDADFVFTGVVGEGES